MSIYQNLVQSRGTITAQQELYRLGLLDPKRVQFNQLGQLKKALPGAFTGSGVLEKEGELALLEKVLLPAFAAKGITGEEGVIRELGMILGNRTGSGLMSRIYQQRETLHMQTEANKSAKDIDGLDALGRQTLAGKEIELHAKWRDVLKELGTAVLPLAIKAVEGLTAVVKGVVAFAREFPVLTKWLTVGFGVLAGVVAVGGVLMLATAGFKALGMALMVGKGAALGAMLLEVAGGLGGIGLALGKMGLLGAAAGAGYFGAKALGAVVRPKAQVRRLRTARVGRECHSRRCSAVVLASLSLWAPLRLRSVVPQETAGRGTRKAEQHRPGNVRVARRLLKSAPRRRGQVPSPTLQLRTRGHRPRLKPRWWDVRLR